MATLYNGYADNHMTIEKVEERISRKTFNNASKTLQNNGFITVTHKKGKGRPIASITLTDKGRQAVNDANGVVGITPSEPPAPSMPVSTGTVTLPQIEELVAVWKKQNKGWTIPVAPQREKEVAGRG